MPSGGLDGRPRERQPLLVLVVPVPVPVCTSMAACLPPHQKRARKARASCSLRQSSSANGGKPHKVSRPGGTMAQGASGGSCQGWPREHGRCAAAAAAAAPLPPAAWQAAACSSAAARGGPGLPQAAAERRRCRSAPTVGVRASRVQAPPPLPVVGPAAAWALHSHARSKAGDPGAALSRCAVPGWLGSRGLGRVMLVRSGASGAVGMSRRGREALS